LRANFDTKKQNNHVIYLKIDLRDALIMRRYQSKHLNLVKSA